MRTRDIFVSQYGLQYLGRRMPCSVGRGGIHYNKCEGDGVTPKGFIRITGCLFRPDRIEKPATWATPILPGDLWSDDPEDAKYNHAVRAPHQYSHEQLRRSDPLYDLVLLTDWNWPHAVPSKGSAIFFHRWRKPRHPTEGCVALASDNLQWLAENAAPGTRVLIR